MLVAMTAVKGGSSIKTAVEEHGVPASTLRDRISGLVVHGTKPGPRPYLSTTEEAELSLFLKSCSNIYGLWENKDRCDGYCMISCCRERDIKEQQSYPGVVEEIL